MSENKKSFKKPLFSIGGLVVIFVIVILVNVLFARVNLRVDATEDNLYSLSEGTKEILDNLKQDVTIKLFYSRSHEDLPPNLKTYAGRVLDFLSEYKYNGGGKIEVEVYDPKPDSVEEEWAQKYGMQGMNIPLGDTIYLGLVAMSADQEETIAFLDPSQEERLEYDLTRLISRVQVADKQKIGIVSGLDVFGGPPMNFNPAMPQMGEPWLFVKELKNTYDVEQIETTAEELPGDLDLLMVIHPKDLSARLEYAIDQYVLKGGPAIVFVDPMATRDESAQQRQLPASNLPKLFKAWGISMEDGKAVVDFDYPTRLRAQNNQVESNPSWLSLTAEAFNRDALITSQLESMLLPVAGALKKAPDSNADYEPLMQSSANSSLEDSFKLQFGAASIRRDFRPTVDRYDLAVKITGKFKTAFPAGKPKKADDKDKEAKKDEDKSEEDKPGEEGLKESAEEAAIIVVSDTDLLWDDYYVRKQNFLGMQLTSLFNDNLNFFQNAAEMLAGGPNLISIRSRGKFDRPFTRVQDLEKKAAANWRDREKELVDKVEETNRKLRELESQKDDSQQLILSKEQEDEIQKFKQEKLRINKELKLVRRHLRSEIESLGTKVKFVNIFLMPLLVSLAGIGYALYRGGKSKDK